MNSLIEDLTKKIESDPENSTLYIERGELHKKGGDDLYARKDFDKAIELGFNDEKVYYNRGKINSKEGWSSEMAVKDFSKVIEINPDHEKAYHDRAQEFQKQREYEKALKDFNKHLELNKNKPSSLPLVGVYYSRGRVNESLNELDSAISDFHMAIKQINAVIIKIKKIVKGENNADIAPFLYDQLLYNAECYRRCCNDYLLLNDEQKRLIDYKKALKECKKAVNLEPSSNKAYVARGKLYLDFREYEHAKEDFEKAIKIYPDEIKDYASIGNEYLKIKDIESAENWYNRALNRINENFNFGWTDEEILSLHDEFSKLAEEYKSNENYEKALDSAETVKGLCDNGSYSGSHYDWSIIKESDEEFISSLKLKKQKKESDLDKIKLKNLHKEELIELNSQLKQSNEQLKEKSLQLKKANEELEDIMAMFAHKFRGPLHNIMWNIDHQNHKKVSLDAVQTMSGLLDIFSTVSTSSELLKQKFNLDKKGNGTLLNLLKKSLALSVSQALTSRNTEKIQQHYFRFAKKKNLIPESTTREQWEDYSDIETDLQQSWEADFMKTMENPALEPILSWIEERLCQIQINGFHDDSIRFEKHGPKASVMLIVFVELLLNAIKYYNSDGELPIIISWTTSDKTASLTIQNPSTKRERTIGKGSGKGHQFLHKISTKLGCEFPEVTYKDDFVIQFPFNINLLK